MKTHIQPRKIHVTITQAELRELVYKSMTDCLPVGTDRASLPLSPDEVEVTVEGLVTWVESAMRKSSLDPISWPLGPGLLGK